jgi:hypothetical protein
MSLMDQTLPIHLTPVQINVRFAPKATKMMRRSE